MDNFKVVDTPKFKVLSSPAYNFSFRKSDGLFLRWGKDQSDDPAWGLPEICDLEISVGGCPKINGVNCRYCYKGNTSAPAKNMPLETFKTILGKMPKSLTQIAFGITGCRTNPDFPEMMTYARANGVIPNFTLSGADLDNEFLALLPGLVGAVAVSYHGDTILCLDTVARLLRVGIKQTNIHAVTYDKTELIRLIDNILISELKVNALVLLSLKPKGRAKRMHNLADTEFEEVVSYARKYNVPLGFDSCSAHRAMKTYPEEFHTMIEPCESFGLFSCYINHEGKYFPCSFAEGEGEWKDGINLLDDKVDFLRDVWFGELVSKYRVMSLGVGRKCLIFPE